jgi:hypothetical protein
MQIYIVNIFKRAKKLRFFKINNKNLTKYKITPHPLKN